MRVQRPSSLTKGRRQLPERRINGSNVLKLTDPQGVGYMRKQIARLTVRDFAQRAECREAVNRDL